MIECKSWKIMEQHGNMVYPQLPKSHAPSVAKFVLQNLALELTVRDTLVQASHYLSHLKSIDARLGHVFSMDSLKK